MPPHFVTMVSTEKKENIKYQKRKVYPTKEEISKEFIELPGPYVFYTNVGQDTFKVIKFKESVGGKILRDCFLRGYNTKGKAAKSGYSGFLGNLSEVYAENASGDVYLVGRWPPGASWQVINIALLKPCTYWFRHEIQILPCQDNATSITVANNDDGRICCLAWTRELSWIFVSQKGKGAVGAWEAGLEGKEMRKFGS